MISNIQAGSDVFGAPVYTYTRLQAVKDGVQVPVFAKTSREAGILDPVYLTRAVFDRYVLIPDGVEGQDIAGRLWDVLWMTACAIRRTNKTDRVKVQLYVRNDNRSVKLVELLATVGPIDMNDARPAITIQLPDES